MGVSERPSFPNTTPSRGDVTFIDPLNTFTGIEKYKLIFWSLRLHGRMFFKEIDLQILRIWQPSENMILIRWNLRGTPRVPWEANGQFQGTSCYKLHRKGKIYKHKVDNLAFIFPQQFHPNLTFLWDSTDSYSSSWVEFYRAVRETLDDEGNLLAQVGLVTC
ncbi:hypothetical protein Cgig2_030140 [Carnegiea gigantea]|uniref:Uncharacterized protein n=1 Tax=Carnegiea gigantea TaxID=171969 RepID=A0A9Q1QA31_9CARY|nr:hypothetical protein Cgig2_030140 [Carnegiea gigantea]